MEVSTFGATSTSSMGTSDGKVPGEASAVASRESISTSLSPEVSSGAMVLVAVRLLRLLASVTTAVRATCMPMLARELFMVLEYSDDHTLCVLLLVDAEQLTLRPADGFCACMVTENLPRRKLFDTRELPTVCDAAVITPRGVPHCPKF